MSFYRVYGFLFKIRHILCLYSIHHRNILLEIIKVIESKYKQNLSKLIFQISIYFDSLNTSFHLCRTCCVYISRIIACAILLSPTNKHIYKKISLQVHYHYSNWAWLHEHHRWINRISVSLPPVFVFAFSVANLTDSVRCVLIVLVAHRHDDTMDMLPNLYQIRPLSRTGSDTIRSKLHDRGSGTNGVAHDVRNESMRGNDVCADPYCPLLCRANRFPSPNRLCDWKPLLIELKIIQFNDFKPQFVSVVHDIRVMVSSIQSDCAKQETSRQNNL